MRAVWGRPGAPLSGLRAPCSGRLCHGRPEETPSSVGPAGFLYLRTSHMIPPCPRPDSRLSVCEDGAHGRGLKGRVKCYASHLIWDMDFVPVEVLVAFMSIVCGVRGVVSPLQIDLDVLGGAARTTLMAAVLLTVGTTSLMLHGWGSPFMGLLRTASRAASCTVWVFFSVLFCLYAGNPFSTATVTAVAAFWVLLRNGGRNG